MLADVGNGSVLLWLLEFFLFVVWFWILITIFSDLFRDSETSGWGKAGWIILVLFVPLIGVLSYFIVRGGGMAERSAQQAAEAQKQFDAYVRSTVGDAPAPADQISKAKSLLDEGTIDLTEYEQLKAKALSN
jgi:hypothetical protein